MLNYAHCLPNTLNAREKLKGKSSLMPTLDQAAREFLAQKRIAVVGVSRKGGVGNGIYKRLRKRGYDMYAINRSADFVEGDACYPNIKSINGGVDAVVIATPAQQARALIEECGELGIRHVWLHGGFAGPNAPDDAVAAAAERGITFIAGSCPMLFMEPTDPAHRCLRWFRRVTGKEAKVAGPG